MLIVINLVELMNGMGRKLKNEQNEKGKCVKFFIVMSWFKGTSDCYQLTPASELPLIHRRATLAQWEREGYSPREKKELRNGQFPGD
jgi:hypothetical protein